jgi:hypothetical protein
MNSTVVASVVTSSPSGILGQIANLTASETPSYITWRARSNTFLTVPCIYDLIHSCLSHTYAIYYILHPTTLSNTIQSVYRHLNSRHHITRLIVISIA